MPQTVARPCHREQVRGLWAYARQEGAEEGEGIPPPVLCIFLVSACWGCRQAVVWPSAAVGLPESWASLADAQLGMAGRAKTVRSSTAQPRLPDR